ncbi:MAG TPA: signal recognition particle protein [Thermoclostridium caenicola]|uniref:Signal recognition particle protein n=1 Tax=Thermoclostridium caenicola TaxID=659425 RepID=A0A1M6K0W5_9FIRM|nr:signal recognition particle protein [Thermoclostridium caenicola]SHJ52557.1 signal recognition particle subunit FFH/SRP54 (srp54) [Thermoclostridium caenicola]HOK43129.1 signal recognition particle protein [Thermoclostridium caenicola]HOL84804.1 signal recognition particle protein [Thermoclostridium caenicola]HOP72802.1 signal recognition particle protein [Thermoclostridium caenicola]HPO77089.1 signal recognition particle protein [Thermoclostridium caenicola]
MVFEGLSEKLQNLMKKIKGQARITEKDVKEMMREVKLALLEADVNFKVVKEFINTISERAVGSEVLESLTPGQQVVKIVHEELIRLMGSTPAKITFSPAPPTVYMMVGLQGSGKTTTSGKLANLLRKDGKKPLLVACDVYRPAAVKQLQVVGSQLNIPVFEMGTGQDPVDIARKAVEHAKSMQFDVVIIDTAGRLHVDAELMEELKRIKQSVKPHEILLVVDAMTGQDAVNVAGSFNDQLGIDGIILTKLDGDTRGGAALSTKAVTGKPIKFVGMGEKLNDLEPFYPDRMASRILGMGDVLSLIEKAQEAFDEKKALELEKKMRSQQFTLDDFLEQMQQLKKMGPLSQVLSMLPGMDAKALKGIDMDDKQMARTLAIIQSMTPQERANPSILNASRRQRIARGSGTSVTDVNRLLKQFEEVQKMIKALQGKKGSRWMKGLGGFRRPF